jgi:serine/threonine protein kinase
MRRLNHPNIIKFIDVYETPDQLMMVMEYCPGDELFDVILARKFFTEEDAKPVFAQVCRALYYLHSLNIIHRDVKPENVLVLRGADPKTGEVVCKLLDFGLSKNAGAGSEAKTFVGTPCYLAPEVEYTSKGLGGTYGLPADCWSLGAVLYVMLVARFPEFEQDANGKVVLRLPPALWDDVSSSAKDLIRSLMNTNPAARLTVAGALEHPWLGKYRATHQELSRVALSCYDLGRGFQEEEEKFLRDSAMKIEEHEEITPSGMTVHRQAMVVHSGAVGGGHVHVGGPGTAGGAPPVGADQLALKPLLHLQR